MIGAGGHAVSLTETIQAMGFEIEAYLDEHAQDAGSFLGAPLLTSLAECRSRTRTFAIAIGDNYTREKVSEGLLRRRPDSDLPSLVHPSASVATSAKIHPGSVVLQGAIVGSHAELRPGTLINSGAIVEHECQVAEFASLGPGARLGGRARVGHRSAIGIGAAVKHGVTISADTVVGAASYVHRDVPEGVVAFGAPATIRKRREPADPYLL